MSLVVLVLLFSVLCLEVVVGHSNHQHEGRAPTDIRITEVCAWGTQFEGDWFELTNTGAGVVDITGWRVDDITPGTYFGGSPIDGGISSIAAGQTVVFLNGNAADINIFINVWFAGFPPPALVVVSYSGTFSQSGDEVNIFASDMSLVHGVSFGVNGAGPPYRTLDNVAELVGTINTFTTLGVAGGFAAIGDMNQWGSPGRLSDPVTQMPTLAPSVSPTTKSPSVNPTVAPSANPSQNPTTSPSVGPTLNPTSIPTRDPTGAPSSTPTMGPTVTPGVPTKAPTTSSPSNTPSVNPTQATLTNSPSTGPSSAPTAYPKGCNLAGTCVVMGNLVVPVAIFTATSVTTFLNGSSIQATSPVILGGVLNVELSQAGIPLISSTGGISGNFSVINVVGTDSLLSCQQAVAKPVYNNNDFAVSITIIDTCLPIPAVIGGVIGGILFLALLITIICCVVTETHKKTFQRRLNEAQHLYNKKSDPVGL